MNSRIVALLALIASLIGAVTVLVNRPVPGPLEVAAGSPPAAAPAADGLRERSEPLADPGSEARDSSNGRRIAVTEEEAPENGADRGVLEASDAPAGAIEAPKAATLAELQEFRAYVDSTLTEIRRDRAAVELRKIERRKARLDETVKGLVELLELTSTQSEQLRSSLLLRLDRETEYVRLEESGADKEILAELQAKDWKTHLEEVAAFLSTEQVKTYVSRLAGWI